MTAMMTAAPAAGRCKRADCPAPLPPQESGRARQFCSSLVINSQFRNP